MPLDAKYYQAPQREAFVWERYQLAETFSRLPALTLKVLFRQRVGLRRSEPSQLMLMVGVLLVLAVLAYVLEWIAALPMLRGLSGATVTHPHLLPYFAGLVLVTGLWQHRGRWKDLRNGVNWHTYSDGISPFEALLATIAPSSKALSPAVFSREWWLAESRVTRYLDPLFFFLVGVGLYFFDWALALWMMFAASCLAVDENLTWRSQLKVYLDWHDSQINASLMKQWRDAQSGKRGSRSATGTGGRAYGLPVPTGVGEDIRHRLEAQGEDADSRRSALAVAERPPLVSGGYLLDAPDNLAGPKRPRPALDVPSKRTP